MSAATFAASAALAPASTSAASSLNRISLPRAPLSARFLRPSLSSVSPSRRRGGAAAAATCRKRSRRAARGIVVSPDGAGALASSLLGLVLGSLLCLSLCPACRRSRAFGRTEVRRAAPLSTGLRGRAGLSALRALWVLLYSLSQSFCTGTVAVKGEHAPHTKIAKSCPALGTAPHVLGKLQVRACRIRPSEKKNSVPQKTRAAPFLGLGLGLGESRVRAGPKRP